MERSYKILEMAGVSAQSFDDAIQKALDGLSGSGERLSWFEVIEQRGTIANGRVAEFQVKIKVGIRA